MDYLQAYLEQYRIAEVLMSKAINYLICGHMHPPSERLTNGHGSLFKRGLAVCHCLLIETSNEGLILVDTGLGAQDLVDPRKSLGRDIATLLHPEQDLQYTAASQVRALGYKTSDVRKIIVTHLDVDHRGALGDFPEATVHCSALELKSALHPRTLMDRRRYRGNWHGGITWQTHEEIGKSWYGFPVLHETESSVGRLVMVHLPGHTRGHSGVAVETGKRSGGRWVLHAGDSIQNLAELQPGGAVPIGIKLFNRVMEADRASRLRTRSQLQELAKEPEVEIICAHDPNLSVVEVP